MARSLAMLFTSTHNVISWLLYYFVCNIYVPDVKLSTNTDEVIFHYALTAYRLSELIFF